MMNDPELVLRAGGRRFSEDRALLLEHLHLAAQAAEFLPLVAGQLAGLPPASSTSAWRSQWRRASDETPRSAASAGMACSLLSARRTASARTRADTADGYAASGHLSSRTTSSAVRAEARQLQLTGQPAQGVVFAATPRANYVPWTTSPPSHVCTGRIALISSSEQVRMSRSRMTRSAHLPGSSDPHRRSWRSA